MENLKEIKLAAIQNHSSIQLNDLQIFLKNHLTEIKTFYWIIFVSVVVFLIYKIIKINKR